MVKNALLDLVGYGKVTTAPNNESRELTTWQEIAAYLAVSVRTAQNWRAEKDLPVKRMGGTGRVVAFTAELDRWKQNALVPLVEPAEPRKRQTALKVAASYGAGLTLLLAILAAGRAVWPERRDNPGRSMAIRLDGDPIDWAGIQPILRDPRGDGPFDASGRYYPNQDFEAVSVTNDMESLYLLLQFASPSTGSIAIHLDTDMDAGTGCNGSEYILFTTARERSGAHLALGDYRNCELKNDFPGAVKSAPAHGASRFVEVQVSLQALRALTPTLKGFRIDARSKAPGEGGIPDIVGPPAAYLLK